MYPNFGKLCREFPWSFFTVCFGDTTDLVVHFGTKIVW